MLHGCRSGIMHGGGWVGHVSIFQSCLAAFGNAGNKGGAAGSRSGGGAAGSEGGAANTAHTQGGGSDDIAARVVVQMTLQLGQTEEFLY